MMRNVIGMQVCLHVVQGLDKRNDVSRKMCKIGPRRW